MRVNVRNIAAQCPKCGGEEFDAVSGRRFELVSQTTMRCVACAATCAYVDLVMQIAEKAVAASAAALEDVRRRRGQ